MSRDFKKRPKESLKKYEKRIEKELLLLQTKIEILEKFYLYRSQNWKNHKQNLNNLKNKPFHFKPYLYECYKIVKIYSEKGLKKSFLLNLSFMMMIKIMVVNKNMVINEWLPF